MNGHHLRGSVSLEAAHKILQIFVNGCIDLVVAYDMTTSKSVVGFDDNWDRTSEVPTGLENGIVLQRFKKMRHDGQLSRRSSLNKSLSLTPLKHSTEYKPVYANRVTNRLNEESKKKSDRNTIHIESFGNDDDGDFHSKDITDKILNDSMYALYRPSTCKIDENFSKYPTERNESLVTSSFDHQIAGEVKRNVGISHDGNAVDGKDVYMK